MEIFADQSKSVEGGLRNVINVVGNFVSRAEAFSGGLKKLSAAEHENKVDA